MTDDSIGHLTSEQLLFLSPWRPVETDTTPLEGLHWECPNCAADRGYFRDLARLEGAEKQFMVQCPACDHLIVLEISTTGRQHLTTRYGGPHIDEFLDFLDRRNVQSE